MMSSFYIGTGCEDIGGVISFMGLPGGKSFARSVAAKSEDMNKELIAVCKEVVTEGLQMEIAETIREKLEGKYTKSQIEKFIVNYNNKTGYVPDELNTLGLAVSYDMGWQKRSTGRRYESISGHGFIVGCRSKKIIGLAVHGKNVKNVIMRTNTICLR